MIVEAKVETPDEVEVTITMSLPLRGWKKLAEDLSINWPSSELHRAIREAVYRLERTVTGNSEQ